MSYLTFRAERALLGALLAAEPIPEQVSRLRAADFGEHEHGRLYDTITTVRRSAPDLSGEALIDAVARRGADPIAGRRYLWTLRTQCPDPRHLIAYARMVQAAAFRREVAVHTERVVTDTLRTPPTARTDHQQQFTAALVEHAKRYDVLATLQPDRAARAVGRATVGPPGETVDWRAQQEHTLLADLLHNPRQALDLATFLPETAFHDPQRREIYRTILTLAETGDPIDEVTVGWQMANLRATARLYGAEPDTGPEPAVADDVYLDRLAHTVTNVSALTVGRNLVAGDAHANARTRADAIIRAVESGAVTSARPTVPLDPTLARPANDSAGPVPRPGW